MLFQSLFFWMLLSKCRVGHADSQRGWFQSLFFWMLLSKPVWRRLHHRPKESFNPYFSGCFSLRLHHPRRHTWHTRFNPYFSGCFSLRRFLQHDTDCWDAGFNPYFSGCFSLSLRRIVVGVDPAGFNPYFSGCFSLRLWLLQVLPLPQAVSILIFLDASL